MNALTMVSIALLVTSAVWALWVLSRTPTPDAYHDELYSEARRLATMHRLPNGHLPEYVGCHREVFEASARADAGIEDDDAFFFRIARMPYVDAYGRLITFDDAP